jgi:hypothetical protein
MQPQPDVGNGEGPGRPGCLTVIAALAATGVFIAGIVNAVLHLAEPHAATMLAAWAIVGPLACVAYLTVRRRPRPVAILAAGLVIGAAVPPALRVMAVLSDNGLSHWTGYFAGPRGLLLAGLAGALLAPVAVRLLTRRRRGARLGVALAIVAGLAALWLAPLAVRARSCHNPARHIARPIPPVAQFQVHVAVGDWALLLRELVRFANDGGWQVWSDVRADPSYPWFEVSVCREPGTQMFFLLDPQKADTVEVDVYQPQGGNGWRQGVQAIEARIARRWPDSAEPADAASMGRDNRR